MICADEATIAADARRPVPALPVIDYVSPEVTAADRRAMREARRRTAQRAARVTTTWMGRLARVAMLLFTIALVATVSATTFALAFAVEWVRAIRVVMRRRWGQRRCVDLPLRALLVLVFITIGWTYVLGKAAGRYWAWTDGSGGWAAVAAA